MEKSVNPLALSVENLVKVLVRAGYRGMTAERFRLDVEAGAPVNSDGTVNIVSYMAWMVREVNSNGDESVQG